MWWLILHHFYRASIRKAWVHTLSTRGGEKNDAKLTAVCMRPPFRLRGQHGDRDQLIDANFVLRPLEVTEDRAWTTRGPTRPLGHHRCARDFPIAGDAKRTHWWVIRR